MNNYERTNLQLAFVLGYEISQYIERINQKLDGTIASVERDLEKIDTQRVEIKRLRGLMGIVTE